MDGQIFENDASFYRLESLYDNDCSLYEQLGKSGGNEIISSDDTSVLDDFNSRLIDAENSVLDIKNSNVLIENGQKSISTDLQALKQKVGQIDVSVSDMYTLLDSSNPDENILGWEKPASISDAGII